MITAPLGVLVVLAINVAVSEWLVRRPRWRLLGSALLVITLTALWANLSLIPSVTDGSPTYDAIFTYVAPLAIFWLLLGVDLRSLLAAGLPMLGLFAVGAVGTLCGVLLAMVMIPAEMFGEFRAALAGMFVATYVGGALNFNAVALAYGVQQEGLVYASAGVVDNLMTTVWMIATIALPRILAPVWRTRPTSADGAGPRDPRTTTSATSSGSTQNDEGDEQTVGPADLACMTALAVGALLIADWLTSLLGALGLALPQVLVLTTLALCLAQFRAVQRLRGARALGMFAVLLFLAAIGALCDISELAGTGTLGLALCALVLVTVVVHGAVAFGAAYALRIDPALAAVASQANIGGGTSALALARGLERADLVAPALLVGALGNAVGTYLGFFAAAILA